eukprot:3233655-Amphidinium_carterae.1
MPRADIVHPQLCLVLRRVVPVCRLSCSGGVASVCRWFKTAQSTFDILALSLFNLHRPPVYQSTLLQCTTYRLQTVSTLVDNMCMAQALNVVCVRGCAVLVDALNPQHRLRSSSIGFMAQLHGEARGHNVIGMLHQIGVEHFDDQVGSVPGPQRGLSQVSHKHLVYMPSSAYQPYMYNLLAPELAPSTMHAQSHASSKGVESQNNEIGDRSSVQP